MAYITGQTTQGCCVDVHFDGNEYHCAPDVMPYLYEVNAANTWTCFYAKAVGTAGECLKIRLHWPRYTPAEAPDGASVWQSKDIPWQEEFGYFLYPARDIVFVSADRIRWDRVEDVVIDGTNLCFSFVMPAETAYFSVCLYYTPARYRDLIAAAETSPYVSCVRIGTDVDGDAVYAFRATDDSVPESGKEAVYLQAAQHCCEHMGIYVCDYMLRWFAEGSGEARSLLKKYVFHIVPVVSVSSWRLGLFLHKDHKGLYTGHETGNPARDWIEQKLPTTQAVHRYLQALPEAPRLLLDLHSGITNYGNKTICQSVTVNVNLPSPQREAMERFVYAVHDHCDYLPTRRYWEGIEDPRIFERYAQRLYGQAHTVEISQFAMYDKDAGCHLPQSQRGLRKFGLQLPLAIDAFLTDEKHRIGEGG